MSKAETIGPFGHLTQNIRGGQGGTGGASHMKGGGGGVGEGPTMHYTIARVEKLAVNDQTPMKIRNWLNPADKAKSSSNGSLLRLHSYGCMVYRAAGRQSSALQLSRGSVMMETL
ncbi:hypothetical protein MSAN_00600600 [Mycena sanguinolenta]|uniref:Uncharacterized protein n=1 Tax=Mycena sanguinolenta TaxID=230812 RepID=A0A8H7DFV3_9AGAR|nr:hypothetical protein MSAN_00600600 [Mycena sanguinolenta]